MRSVTITLLLLIGMLVLACIGSPLQAQEMGCGTDRLLNEYRKDSAFRLQEKKMNEAIQKLALNKKSVRLLAPSPLPNIVLPVAFHIVSSNPAAMTDAQVAAIISDLNDAFSKKGNYAASQGADTHIQFKLAQKDPDGGITNGITRTTSFWDTHLNTPIEDHKLKNLVDWDPDKYINIWYISSIDDEIYADFSCGVWRRGKEAGHASMPPVNQSTKYLDGIVVTGSGALLAHEMGHYLGLYHTFEGGCFNNNCETDGDRVCDTQPDGSHTVGSCTSPTNSCLTDTLSNYSKGFFPKDVPDPVKNFMDYTSCPVEFTQGQADRMQDAVTAYRSTLLNNGVLTPPCADNIGVSFVRDKADPLFNATVNFTSTTSGTISSYQWTVNGTAVTTAANLSYAFPTAGNNPRPQYKVTLKAFGSTPGCFASYTDYVMPNCGLTARFYNNKTQIAAKAGFLLDTILFTNNTVNNLGGTVSYQWIMSNSNIPMPRTVVTSNVPGAGADDLNWKFDAFGGYFIKLIATNGGCVDSTNDMFLSVLDPTPDLTVFPFFARCSQQTKVRLQFSICNNGFAPTKPGIPVTFYDSDPTRSRAKQVGTTFTTPDSLLGYCCASYTVTLDVGRPRLDTLFAVVNDVGGAVPIALPNNPNQVERFYTNNTGSINNFRFRVTPTPTTVTLEPGDTYLLSAISFPDFISSSAYTWSAAYNLSCSTCQATQLKADTSQLKRVVAAGPDGCFDTAYVDIKVPPADDYTVSLNGFVCSGKDSLGVNFVINNGFKRGVIPQKLRVAFYQGDPATATAVLLKPVFEVPTTVQSQQQSYTAKIAIPNPGIIYAVINDTATQVPVALPNTSFTEKLYSNNFTSTQYQPINKIIDTAICTGDTLMGRFATGTYVDHFTTNTGCDSARTLKLTVRPEAIVRTTINATICQGDSYGTYKTAGTYTDVFKGTNACDSIRTLVLKVVALPGPPTIAVTGKPGFCPGGSILLTSSTANGNQWFLNGVSIPGATNSTYAATVAGNYSVKASDGCTSGSSADIAVTAFPQPATPVITAGGPTIFCPGDSVILNSNAASGYQWLFNGVAIPAAKTGVYTAKTAGNYTVQITDANNCTSNASAAVSVSTVPAPATPTITASGPTSFCPGGSVQLSSSAPAGNQWYLDGNMVTGATGFSFTANAGGNYTVRTSNGSVCPSAPATPVTVTVFTVKKQTNDVIICKGSSYFAGGKQQTVSGTYTDVLKTYQGCDSTVTTNLYVAPLPAHFLPPDTVACIGSSYDLSLFYPTVNWSTGALGPAISITQPGAYSAQVIDKNGCKGGDTINVGFKYCITIQTPDAFTPNNDGKNDVFKPLIGAPVTNYRLQIYNRWGQMVYETRDYTKGWNGNFSGAPEPAGTYVYLITLTDMNGEQVIRKGTLVLIR